MIFNKIPKYYVNDIVIIDKGFSGHHIVGVIKDVSNHRDTGEVIYHIIFNSCTPRKVFEEEIVTKFNTDKFKDGQSIYKQLLVKMYHTNRYKYLSENEVLVWIYANNFEENVDHTIYCPHSDRLAYYSYRYDPKFIERCSVDSSLKALEELNKKEIERIMAEPVRINVDDKNIEEIKKMINNTFGVPKFEYKKIIFNGPCTIILWKDGTKTMAKASSGKEVFDPEKGVAICFMKKMLGHTETNKVLRKANKDYYDELARKVNRQLDEELKKATFPLPEGVTFRPFNFDVPMDNNKVIKVEEKGDK